jgi:aldose 1-epimerase
MPEITLRRDALELTLAPEQGGSILSFRSGGFDLMRPAQGSGNVRTHAAFPLVPYSGRIDHGRFAFRGRQYRVPPNFPPEPHAIHGEGWMQAWATERSDATSATLTLDHHSPGGVFRFRAEQRFALHPDRLDVTLAVTHRGDAPMPYGLGLHPYLVRRPDSLLSAEVTGVWVADETNIPRRLEPVPPAWNFRLRRNVNELELDNNFQGWNGTARIDWPDEGVSLAIEADDIFRHLVVFVPKGQPYFAVEPASNVADGFNLMERGVEGTGVRVLEPGDTLAGRVTFRVLGGSPSGGG